MRTTPLLAVLLALLGCPKRNASVEDQLAALLEEADSAWDRRGAGGFQPVDDALQKAWALAPDAPEVIWRLTRLRVAEAQTDDDPDRRVAALAQARSLAWTCVQADGNRVAAAMQAGADGAPDDRVRAALERIAPERRPCVAWGTYAWARWLVDFGGAAGSLDLETLDAASEAGRTWDDPWRSRIAWAEGMVAASRPPWAGQDKQRAATILSEVEDALPGELEVRVDRYVLVERGTAAEPMARNALGAARPNSPEERAVMRRALDQRP